MSSVANALRQRVPELYVIINKATWLNLILTRGMLETMSVLTNLYLFTYLLYTYLTTFLLTYLLTKDRLGQTGTDESQARAASVRSHKHLPTLYHSPGEIRHSLEAFLPLVQSRKLPRRLSQQHHASAARSHPLCSVLSKPQPCSVSLERECVLIWVIACKRCSRSTCLEPVMGVQSSQQHHASATHAMSSLLEQHLRHRLQQHHALATQARCCSSCCCC